MKKSKVVFYVIDKSTDCDVSFKSYIAIVYNSKGKVIDEFAALTVKRLKLRIYQVYGYIDSHKLHPYQEQL